MKTLRVARPWGPLALGVVAVVIVLVVAPSAASDDGDEQSAAGGSCEAWDVTYALSGALRISDTPFGAGDGVHQVGPGTLVIRVAEHGEHGEGGGRLARLLSFELREHFTVMPQAVLWRATVSTDAVARATSDDSGFVGAGTLGGGTLQWSGPIHGYRTDGAFTCEGSLCGKFGAPPGGRSELHDAPAVVRFEPLRFGRRTASFQMANALVSESDTPRQRTFLSMVGRETRRTCVPSP